jgi:hypothetical protein
MQQVVLTLTQMWRRLPSYSSRARQSSINPKQFAAHLITLLTQKSVRHLVKSKSMFTCHSDALFVCGQELETDLRQAGNFAAVNYIDKSPVFCGITLA